MGAWLIYRLALAWVRFKIRRRLNRGLEVEGRLKAILIKQGYTITAIQPVIAMVLSIDGKPSSYEVRPDALAKKGKSRYIVEVKSGEVVTNPLFRETRRQLFEYYHSTPSCDGVLLVDADTAEVRHIVFPKPLQPPRWMRLKVAASFALGFGFAYLLTKLQLIHH